MGICYAKSNYADMAAGVSLQQPQNDSEAEDAITNELVVIIHMVQAVSEMRGVPEEAVRRLNAIEDRLCGLIEDVDYYGEGNEEED